MEQSTLLVRFIVWIVKMDAKMALLFILYNALQVLQHFIVHQLPWTNLIRILEASVHEHLKRNIYNCKKQLAERPKKKRNLRFTDWMVHEKTSFKRFYVSVKYWKQIHGKTFGSLRQIGCPWGVGLSYEVSSSKQLAWCFEYWNCNS